MVRLLDALSIHLTSFRLFACDAGDASPSVLAVDEDEPPGRQGLIALYNFRMTFVQEEITSAADKLIHLSKSPE